MREFRCFGPPGTGKTTWLGRQIHRAVEQRGPGDVIVCSFTKAAVHELNSRKLPIPDSNIGTLHSLAYRALGNPTICETMTGFKAFHEATGWELGGVTREDVDDGYATCGSNEHDMVFASIQAKRARMIPSEMWTPTEQRLWKEWSKFKADTGQCDFTDLIEDALKYTYEAPGSPSVGYFDESQDFTPLELQLVRHWGERMETFVLAGDDDQCQPPGTSILTDSGLVNIEHLNPAIHRVVSYDRTASEIVGRRKGKSFQVERNIYFGKMLQVTAGYNTTIVTPNHKWLTRWKHEGNEKVCVVYLMRSGMLWRVGWCQLFNADGAFHLGVRCRLEGAEEAWVLRVTHSRTEAFIWESYISIHYGLPTVTFQQVPGATHLSQDALNVLWRKYRDNCDLKNKAYKCLLDHGRIPSMPLYRRDIVHRGGASLFVTATANLLPGLMLLPIDYGKKQPSWTDIQVSSNDYEGPIYSLKVEPYPYYVADGIITHNSIYGFKGVSATALLHPPLPPESIRILKQSWRVPVAIHQKVNSYIHQIHGDWRQKKEYLPREGHEGGISNIRATYKRPEEALTIAKEYVEMGKTVLWLASCSYMLQPLIKLLREEGIPFSNPYRRRRGDWNPLHPKKDRQSLAHIVASFMNLDERNLDYWTGSEFKQWSKVVKGVWLRGARKKIDWLKDDEKINIASMGHYMHPDHIDAAFGENQMEWLQDNLLSNWKKSGDYVFRVAKQGSFWLTYEPFMRIGTIHSVKGGEADVVILFPDVSPQAMNNPTIIQGKDYKEEPPQNALIRLFYVGMTRAKEQLIIASPASNFCVAL